MEQVIEQKATEQVNPFKKLGLPEHLLKAIKDEHFVTPSEIQEHAIPLVLQGKDVLAGSATGSGKTLAFGAGAIERTIPGAGVQALILTPTRELAEQVCSSLKIFSKYKPLTIIPVYGGVSIRPQIDMLPRADIVVGTPGRIIDHLERQTFSLRKIATLVLDEADRMLDMGFIEDVERIINACPIQRQTMLFSATLSRDIISLAQNYMEDPVEVSVECLVDPTKLAQFYYDTPDNMKFSLLVHLLQHEEADLIMVFCNSQKTTDIVSKNLKRTGIDALPIHGGFSQGKRNMVMKQFHEGKVHVLVCTDVAARGLDIEGVSHVYNYDVPKEAKQYVHRIGRTARAGKDGKAITILTSRDHDNFRRILRENDVTINKEAVPAIEHVSFRWHEQPMHGGFHRGGRGGRYAHRSPPRDSFHSPHRPHNHPHARPAHSGTFHRR